MQAPVDDHLIAGGECLAAKFAPVWPRICVDALMLAQQVASLKVFRTEGALERPFVRVDAADVE